METTFPMIIDCGAMLLLLQTLELYFITFSYTRENWPSQHSQWLDSVYRVDLEIACNLE